MGVGAGAREGARWGVGEVGVRGVWTCPERLAIVADVADVADVDDGGLRVARFLQLTQKNGEWPAAIHNNFIVGADNKRERFQNISMWMVKPDLTCRPFPHYLPPMPRGTLSFVFKASVGAE